MVDVGIYKRLITSGCKVLVELEEVQIENGEFAASFKKGATKEKVLSEVFNIQ